MSEGRYNEDQITYLMSLIRNTYRRLATEPRDWVALARLRDDVGHRRNDVDEALRRLSREDDVVIAPEENQKSLSDWDRQCELWIGGQAKHLISIG